MLARVGFVFMRINIGFLKFYKKKYVLGKSFLVI